LPEIPGGHGSFLPGDPRTREPWHVNQQTILRAGILGAVTIVLFVFLAVRLWALEIISGNQYLRIAQDNQIRTVRLQAPRGPILARDGQILVKNRLSYDVQVWYAELPGKGAKPTRYRVLQHLAQVLKTPLKKLLREVKQRKKDPLTPVVAKADVGQWQRDYVLERADQFPGVEIAPRYVRYYPRGPFASQVLGSVGMATEAEIKADRSGATQMNDVVGQSGVEAAFDKYLRGQPGLAMQRVDSQGHPRSELVPNPEPQPGDSVLLTLDVDLQAAAQRALLHGIQDARNSGCIGCWNADGGSIVALDPRDGSVLAMANYPTFPPSILAGRVTNSRLAHWGLTAGTAEKMNYPSINRATSGLYPPGSTFKPVTAIAALQNLVVSPSQNLPCTGELKTKDGRIWHNWDPNANSMINLPTALAISCDTYFYQLGEWIYGLPKSAGSPIQTWANKFGLGRSTGIEIGDERGLVPTPAWQRAHFKNNPWARIWKTGDSLNLSIGQKDLQVTPLQMARLYAGIATGKLVYPHLLYAVEQNGRVIDPGVAKVPLPIGTGPVFQQNMNAIRDGLYMATHSVTPQGTSQPVFGNFPVPIAGKTGTAEKWSAQYQQNFNESWWCGYGPVDKPTLVVCAVIENGGHGGTAAAPAAREVFQAYFGIKNSTFQVATHSD
jgi:penicillin-binding protein 2